MPRSSSKSQGRPPLSSASKRGGSEANDKIEKGAKVMAHFHGKKSNPEYPGVVSRVYKDGTCDIQYDDGDVDNAIPQSAVRVFTKTKRGRNKADLDDVQDSVSDEDDALEDVSATYFAGQNVMAHFRGKKANPEYPGKVTKVHRDGTYDVKYDDGDEDKRLTSDMLRPENASSGSASKGVAGKRTRLKSGMRVTSHFRGSLKNEAYPGVVSKVYANGNVDIKYDDGDVDKNIKPDGVSPLDDNGKDERRVVSAANNVVEKIAAGADSKLRKVLRKGTRVKVKSDRGKFVAATLKKIDYDYTCTVDYRDGDTEEGVEMSRLRSEKGTSIPSPPTIQTILDACEESEDVESGRLPGEAFRSVIKKLFGVRLTGKDIDELKNDFGDRKGKLDFEAVASAIERSAIVKDDVDAAKGRKGAKSKRKKVSASTAIIAHEVKRTLQEECPSSKKLARQFEKFDEDKDGTVDSKEFSRATNKLGFSLDDEQVDALIRCFDVDGDGRISYREFCRYVLSVSDMTKGMSDALNSLRAQRAKLERKKKIKLEEAFEKHDKDDEGVVTPRFFKAALSSLKLKLSEDERDDVIEGLVAATGGDGKRIDYSIFCELIKEDVAHIDKVGQRLPSFILEARRCGMDIHAVFEDVEKGPKEGTVSRVDFSDTLSAVLGFPFTSEDLLILCFEFPYKKKYVDVSKFLKWIDEKVVVRSTKKRSKDMTAVANLVKKSIKRRLAKNSDNFLKPFKAMDEDGSGALSRREFLKGLEKLGLGEIPNRSKRALLEMLDGDKDDSISYEEFHNFLFNEDGEKSGDDASDASESNEGDSDSPTTKRKRGSSSAYLVQKDTEKILAAVAKFAKRKKKKVIKALGNALKRYEGGSLRGVISKDDFKDLLDTLGCSFLSERQTGVLAAFGDVDGDDMVDCACIVDFLAQNVLKDSTAAALESIRAHVKARSSDSTFGLFDDSLSLRSRLKKVYKAKAPKLASSEHIKKQLQKYKGKEDKLVQMIAKKYKLAPGIDVRKMFSETEDDENGTVSKSEFQKVVKSIGASVSRSDLSALTKHLTSDDDPEDVPFEVFASFVEPKSDGELLAGRLLRYFAASKSIGVKLKHDFEQLDKKKRGIVSGNAFRNCLQNVGFPLKPSNLFAIVDRFDLTGNGNIEYNTFLKFCKKGDALGWEDKPPLARNSDDDGSASDTSLESDSGNDESPTAGRSKWFRMGRSRSSSPTRKSQRSPSPTRKKRGKLEIIPRKLREALRKYAAEQEDGALLGLFVKTDRSKKGTVTASQFRKVLTKLKIKGLTKDHVDLLSKCFDVDEDGKVDYVSFVRYTRSNMDERTQQVVDSIRMELRAQASSDGGGHLRARKIFAKLDKNDDGFLDKREFRKGIGGMGMELSAKETSRLMKYFSKSNDGSLNYPEFLQLVDPVPNLKFLEKKLRRALLLVAATKKELRKVFTEFDTDDSGYLSFTQFRDMLDILGLPLSDDEVCVLMDCFDKSKGKWNKIKYSEFEKFAVGKGRLRSPEHMSFPSNQRSAQHASSDEEGDLSGSESDSFERSGRLKSGRSRRRPAQDSDSDGSDGDGSTEMSYDEDYARALKRSLKKAFKTLDVDGNGYLDAVELGIAMRSFGRECSDEEIEKVIKKGDKSKGLSEKEFIAQMMRLLKKHRDEDFPQREKEIRTVFESADLAGTGLLSLRQFEKLISKFGVNLSKKEFKAIVDAIDTDDDGSISYGEFEHLIRLVGGGKRSRSFNRKRAKSDVSRLNKTAFSAIAKIARGPVKDPSQYLNTFMGLPAHFRPSILRNVMCLYRHTAECALRGGSSWDVASSKSSVTEFVVQFRGAEAVSSATKGVTERKLRFCLFDKRGDFGGDLDAEGYDDDNSSECSFVGNVYEVPVLKGKNTGDAWRVDKIVGSMLVRVSGSEAMKALSLFTELVISKETEGGNVEMGCGWCSLKLSDVKKAIKSGKDIQLHLQGGTPKHPSRIRDEDMSTKRSGWRALTRMGQSGRVRPTVLLRCTAGTKASKASSRKSTDVLPSNIILSPHCTDLAREYVQLFRAHCFRNLLNRGTRGGTRKINASGPPVVCSPALHLFPQMLADASISAMLGKAWMRGSVSKSKDYENHFASFVLEYWPLLAVSSSEELPEKIGLGRKSMNGLALFT